MTDMTALPVTTPLTVERVHLFGAVGAEAQAVTDEERQRRERMATEAARQSGNFYVSRMVSMFGASKAPHAA